MGKCVMVLPYIITLTIISLLVFQSMKISFNKKDIAIGKITIKYTCVSKLLIITAYIIFIIFSVFRVIDFGFGGVDSIVYKIRFLEANKPLIDSLKLQNNEYGYGFIIWILRKISDDYRIVLFFVHSITFSIYIYYLKFITWNRNTIVSIFLLSTILLDAFNTTRNTLAIFIALLVYILLNKRNYKLTILLSITAVSIHISALILFPIIFIHWIMERHDKFSSVLLILYICIMTFLSVLSTNFLMGYFTRGKYSVYQNYEGIALGTYLAIILVFIISAEKFDTLYKKNNFNKTLITILPVALICIPFQMRFSIIYRMVLYFIPILYTLIPEIIKEYPIKFKKGCFKNIIITVILMMYIVIRVYKFFTVEIVNIGLPYINMIFK